MIRQPRTSPQRDISLMITLLPFIKQPTMVPHGQTSALEYRQELIPELLEKIVNEKICFLQGQN